jgi:P27 family predicted phage terminase small subunit
MKTKQQKIITGTFRKDRVKVGLTFAPLKEIPEPFEPLKEHGAKYFRAVCECLISNKTLTAADIPAVSRAAQQYAMYCCAVDGIRKHGAFQETKSGYTAKNAYFQILQDCEKVLQGFERAYGLTLSSRLKFDLPDPITANLFDEFKT